MDFEETCQTIVNEAVRVGKANSGSLLLRKGEGFERVYTSLPKDFQVKPRKHGFAYQAYKLRRIVVFRRSKIIRYHPVFKKSHVNLFAFIPLSYRKKSIGVLSLNYNRREPLTTEQLKILKILGSLASLVIRKMQYYRETKSALETRDLFISLASHEFRTPLTAIKIYAELINLKLPNPDDPERKISENLLRAIDRLTGLINEFLQLDQIKRGKLRYYWGEHRLGKLLKQAVSDFNLRHPDYILNFKNGVADQTDIILADQEKLLLVINNLLDNAAKFSKKGSKIDLSLKKNGKNFVILVQDYGYGIGENELPRIFERFYKGLSRKSGIGLGLYLTREIVEKHRGKITVESEVNRGTTFKIILPARSYAKS